MLCTLLFDTFINSHKDNDSKQNCSGILSFRAHHKVRNWQEHRKLSRGVWVAIGISKDISGSWEATLWVYALPCLTHVFTYCFRYLIASFSFFSLWNFMYGNKSTQDLTWKIKMGRKTRVRIVFYQREIKSLLEHKTIWVSLCFVLFFRYNTRRKTIRKGL